MCALDKALRLEWPWTLYNQVTRESGEQSVKWYRSTAVTSEKADRQWCECTAFKLRQTNTSIGKAELDLVKAVLKPKCQFLGDGLKWLRAAMITTKAESEASKKNI